jgi:hypothetical protein
MFLIFVGALAFMALLACWVMGEQRPLTKAIFTLLFLASCVPMLFKDYDYLSLVALCVFVVIVGGSTFGLDWLTQRQ